MNTDTLNSVGNLVSNIANVVKDAQILASKNTLEELKKEILDLDLAEKASLAAKFEAQFDLPNDTVEKTIERVFEVLLTVAAIASSFLPKD